MASEDILLRLKLLDEFSATLKKYQGELKQTETASAQASSKMTTGFNNVKGALQAIAGAAVTGAVIQALRGMIAAAAEAEQAQKKLAASLIATDKYSGSLIDGINSWSKEMMKASGISDELAVSLVAEGVAMGKTVEQSQRLVIAATNLAPIVGSVEGAFSLLIRASNGSMESLKRYGIAVTEAEIKTGDFESVIQRLEQRFSGQAAAEMDTFSGAVKGLKNNFGELQERLGQPMIEALADVAHGMVRGLDAAQRFGDAIERLSSQDIQKFLAVAAAVTGNFGLAIQLGMVKPGPSGLPTQMMSSHTRLPDTLMPGHGPGVKPWAPFDPDAEKKRRAAEEAAKAAAEKLKADLAEMAKVQNAMLANLGKDAADRFAAQKDAGSAVASQEAVILGKLQAERDMIAEIIRLNEQRAAGLDPAVRGRMDAQKGGLGAIDTANAVAAGQLQAQTIIIANTIDSHNKKLKELTAADTDRLNAQKQYTDADRRATEEGIKATKTRTMTDMEAAQAAYSAAQALIGIGIAARQGNMGGVVGGVGQLGMMAGGFWQNTPLFLAGAGLSLLGGLLGDGQPRTFGGRTRQDLGKALDKAGIGGGGTLSDADMAGMLDVWNEWAKLISGVTKDFGGGAGMLAGSFKDLNFTFAETADAVAYITAQTQEMTLAEAKMATARAALFSIEKLTLQQLNDLVNQYQSGSNWMQRYEQLQKRGNELLDAASKTKEGTPQRDKALQDLAAWQDDWIALQRAQIEQEQAWERRLQDAGASRDEINKLKDPTEATAQNTFDTAEGIKALIRLQGGTGGLYGYNNNGTPDNNGDKTDSESFRESYITRRRGGGTTVVVNVSGAVGDHRDIAKKLHKELRTLREFGEVSN